MINIKDEEVSLGAKLFDLGWRQGTLFTASGAVFTINKYSNEDVHHITTDGRLTKPSEKFVLITQDCDLVTLSKEEPTVEAILCKLESPKFVGRITPKTVRWFVVNPETGLVAYARYRVTFDKNLLSILQPEPWPRGPKQLDEFTRWLARRYDRPAIPDKMYEVFQKPLENELALLAKENPDIFEAFNRVVEDVRVNIPENEDPPYHLQLILLVESDGLSEEEADAIDIFKRIVTERLDPHLVTFDPIRILADDQISLKEFRASRPIYLGYYTYQGEEIEGAEPPR